MLETQELQHIPLFKDLKLETNIFISQHAFTRDHDAGKEFVAEGVSANYCYFLFTGYVRVLRISQDGRLQILGRFGPGSPLNIISLFSGDGVNLASIETLSPCSVIVLDDNTFRKLLENYPDFSLMIIKHMAERMTKMIDMVANLSFNSVRIRLARLVIQIADNPSLEIGWTQEEIAAQIGTVRDVVGRILRDFESKGLIARNFQQITLLNRDGLLHEAKLN